MYRRACTTGLAVLNGNTKDHKLNYEAVCCSWVTITAFPPPVHPGVGAWNDKRPLFWRESKGWMNLKVRLLEEQKKTTVRGRCADTPKA